MSISNHRNRSVIFRLTEQEYDALRLASENSGARSLSDYTRSGLLDMTKDSQLGNRVERGFLEINERLGEIQQLLDDLADRLARSADDPDEDDPEEGSSLEGFEDSAG